MTYTAWFNAIRKDDIALAGGKGANLGELSRAGLPVPAGFVLTTRAYDTFVESNDIGGTIAKLASMPRVDSPAAFEEAAERIHALFSGGSNIPEEIAEELRAAYAGMAGRPSRCVPLRPPRAAEGSAPAGSTT